MKKQRLPFLIKKTWKWILGIILFVALALGGFYLYTYLSDEYIPKKKLDKAVSEILEKYNNKDTQIEYAYYILRKEHDWGYGKIKYYGFDYRNGNEYISYVLSDYRESAFNAIENQAYQEDAKCQLILGEIYHFGTGKVYNLFDKSKGYEIVERNDEKAAYWWQKSASNEYVDAFFYIGWCYMNGRGVSIDMEKAIYWLKKGAEAGDATAQTTYGDLYSKGVAILMENGSKIPVYCFDIMLINWLTDMSEGLIKSSPHKTILPKDIEQAKYWWKQAAEQGDKEAKERLQKIF